MWAIDSLFSRRNMLLGLGSAATVGVLATTQAGQSQVQKFKDLLWQRLPGRRNVRLATATVDDWALQIGTTFKASTGHTLKLADVVQFDHQNKRPSGLRDRAFTAGFEVVSGAGVMPDQLLLRVTHAEGGTFEMFLTGAGPRKPLRRIAVFG
jgi:hypothetical protein